MVPRQPRPPRHTWWWRGDEGSRPWSQHLLQTKAISQCASISLTTQIPFNLYLHSVLLFHPTPPPLRPTTLNFRPLKRSFTPQEPCLNPPARTTSVANGILNHTQYITASSRAANSHSHSHSHSHSPRCCEPCILVPLANPPAHPPRHHPYLMSFAEAAFAQPEQHILHPTMTFTSSYLRAGSGPSGRCRRGCHSRRQCRPGCPGCT